MWSQSVFGGGLNGNSNHRQEGMTLSCCHQHLFLPNPKETDSIILLEGKDHSLLSLSPPPAPPRPPFLISSKSQGEVHKIQSQSLELRQKRDQETSHCPNCPDNRDRNLLGKHFCKGPPVIGSLTKKEEDMGEKLLSTEAS